MGSEGRNEGRNEGRSEGRSEGSLGRNEGRSEGIVGRSEGSSLGRSEGSILGSSLGRNEGRSEGRTESPVYGDRVMTPREKELLEAARRINIFYSIWPEDALSAALQERLKKAIAAYTDNPQADHEAALARRVAEDGPPPVTEREGFDGSAGILTGMIIQTLDRERRNDRP